MKILVTGGLGFIGSNIVSALIHRDHAVTVFDDSSRGNLDNVRDFLDRIMLVEGDIRDKSAIRAACEGIEAIVHLAAIQGTENFYRIPHHVLDVNVNGVVNMLDTCAHTGARRFFFASSSEVYGTPDIFPTPESSALKIPDVLNPRYSYAGSKIIGELMTINYAKYYGFDYTIVRYHNVYGPAMGWQHVIPQFIARLEKGEEFTVQGDGEQRRAFCYVDDAVSASLQALLTDAGANQIFNIGNPEKEWTINELVELLCKISGKKIVQKHVPFEGEGVRRRIPDIALAQELLGFNPKVQLEEGLRRTHDWYASAIRKETEVVDEHK